MSIWEDKYIETRNIYEGQFHSVINAPSLKGNILQQETDDILSIYRLEICKTPCALHSRIDPATFKEVTDMCVMVTFTMSTPKYQLEDIKMFPIPLTEISENLITILKEHKIIT